MMKKVLCAAFAAVILAGCSSGKEETKTMTCTAEQKSNGSTITQTIKFDYQGDNITKQDQKTVIVAPDKKTYEAILPTLRAASLESKAKGVEGMSYSLKEDKDKFSITENIVFDITEINPKDYGTFTNQTLSGKKMVMDLEKTKENIEKSGLTCKK
ncbi:YehR family protein [[Clostridium] innocuum]|nr:YehR family protein [[Clostridium] innocuum]